MEKPLILALALLLAGCATPASPEEAETAAVEAGAAALPEAELARIEGAGLVDKTIWANGTFSFAQHERLLGQQPLPPGAGDDRVVLDLTQEVPRGVPTRLFAQVDAELTHGDLDLRLHVSDEEWRTGSWDAPFGGYTRFEAALVRSASEPIMVSLAYDQVEPQTEFSYTLSVRIVSDPTLLVSGVVAGVTLPEAASLVVELEGAPREFGRDIEPRVLMVYAPDDAFLGAFPVPENGTRIDLPPTAEAGEYALLLSQGGHNARLRVAGGATMRALGQTFELAPPTRGDAPGHAAWSVTYPSTPLLVGVFFSAPTLGQDVAVRIDGPAGPVLEAQVQGGPWLTLPTSGFSPGFGWDSAYGAPGLASGTYAGDLTFATAAGVEPPTAQPFAAFYVR